MVVNKYIIGRQNEMLAVKFLKKKGYKILEKNYVCKVGEIDIIAKHKNIVVFIEVKYRASEYFGLPREAVTPYKQDKIRKVATFYVRNKDILESKCRFDVVEILNDEITHIENCF